MIRVGEEGAPDTLNIPESAVCLELVAELFPESKLSPEDPAKRGYARYFAQRCALIPSFRSRRAGSPLLTQHRSKPSYNEVVGGPFMTLLFQGEGKTDADENVWKGLEEIQGMLSRFDGPFLLGNELSIGDLAVAPFVGRIFASPKYGKLPRVSSLPASGSPFLISEYRPGLLSEEFGARLNDDKYKVFRDYKDALVSRPSWKVSSSFPRPRLWEALAAPTRLIRRVARRKRSTRSTS